MNRQQAKCHHGCGCETRAIHINSQQFLSNREAFHVHGASFPSVPEQLSSLGVRGRKRQRKRSGERKGGWFSWIWSTVIHGRKRVQSLPGKKIPSRFYNHTHTHTQAHTHTNVHLHTLGTGQRWLCVGLVRLADRFTSVHNGWLTCAFTGGYRHLGNRLSHIVQRWLSVHGDWRNRTHEKTTVRGRLLSCAVWRERADSQIIWKKWLPL